MTRAAQNRSASRFAGHPQAGRLPIACHPGRPLEFVQQVEEHQNAREGRPGGEELLQTEIVRRTARRPEAIPLGPIRCLHYFLPVIEELLANPVPESYLTYLRSKVAMRPAAGPASSTAG